METEIVKQILSWPTIVQGALGSGLFWLIIVVGEYVTKLFKNKFGEHKKDMNHRDSIINDVLENKDIVGMKLYLISAIYASMHYIIKAFIFVLIGNYLNDFIPIFGFIGYLGGFIYLLLALNHVPDIDSYANKTQEEEQV